MMSYVVVGQSSLAPWNPSLYSLTLQCASQIHQDAARK
jgi:hypothetical protein